MNINNLPYSELLKLRCQRLEKRIPWHIMPKSGTKDFCNLIGAPSVQVIEEIDEIESIINAKYPNEFVIKPSNGHSDKGVMVLSKIEEDLYYESFTEKHLNIEQIIMIQKKISKQYELGSGYLIEEYIPDVYGEKIPHDFKFFAFQGEIAIIMEVNRNKSDKQKWYFFENDFSPIKNGKIVPGVQNFNKFRGKTPPFFSELFNLAKRVSYAIPTPFARIDLYFDGKIAKVGEITLTPYYGFPYTWSKNLDYMMGSMWIDSIYRMGYNIYDFYDTKTE